MSKRSSAELALRSLRLPGAERTPSAEPGIVVAPLEWSARSAWVTSVVLFAADAVAFIACTLLLGREGFASKALGAGALAWFGLRFLADLYESIALAPPEEVRRSFLTTTAGLLVHLVVLYVAGAFGTDAIAALYAWSALLVVPWGARQLAKGALIKARLYGAPVVVIGTGETARALVEELQRNREQGLQPVAMFGERSLRGKRLSGIPVVGGIEEAADFQFPYPVEHALIALAADDSHQLRQISDRFAARFAHVHVTPEFVGLANLWVQPRSIGPMLTFEFRQDRLSPLAFRLKRVIDVLLGAVFFVLALPLIAVCAALVKIVSPGPAFFSQVREGHRGRLIRVWKIRTMVTDAEHRLHEHLKENTAARREWAERAKLDSDPRVIPGLGGFLRQWSLDELPQLWNVVSGSMSLVGPRPFPEYHLNMFPTGFRELRRLVPPGVTGLWQVTYRTDGDLTHQRAADSYYVHNWSIWLDFWILLRTVRVVFSGSGS